MSGRYSIVSSPKSIETHFKAKFEYAFEPNVNAHPMQMLPVISSLHPDKIVPYYWGLIPYWAKSSDIGQKNFNAWAEGIHKNSSFKIPLERRRCLVPANGYIEWRNFSGIKSPYFVYSPGNPLIALAGLFDTWMNEATEEITRSFTIITTKSNNRLRVISRRMPVILRESNYQKWLDVSKDYRQAMSLLRPMPDKLTNAYHISLSINNPVHNYPELLEPQQDPLAKDNLDIKMFFV